MKKLLAVVAAAMLSAAFEARAEIAPASQVPVAQLDGNVSIWGLYSYYYSWGGYGLGARYQKTLVPQGVLKNAGVRDDIGIEFGLDYAHYSWDFGGFGSNWSLNEFSIVAGGVWNFWLSPQLAVYPKIDLGYRFGSATMPAGWPSYAGKPSYGGFLFQGAAGVVYKLDKLFLRAEAGSGYLRAGVAMNF